MPSPPLRRPSFHPSRSAVFLRRLQIADSFDYVIVGAGSAGCVLASRLTEDPDTTVALIEAGGRGSRREVEIPAAFSRLFRTSCDWAYFTEPQRELKGRKLFWPRGKMLGGTSSMNAMIYTRGHREDYDRWARSGIDGWSFDEIRPVFRKVERCDPARSDEVGTGGPLEITDLRTTNPLSHLFVDACVERGIPQTDDFNGPRPEGAGFFQVTQRRGKRFSCAAAYLQPALARPNLFLFPNTLTTRIVFDGTRATGVTCSRGTIHARREVILAGGVINSPHLLMLSGIGPADALRRFGIAVVADLPGVGRNLQDHLCTGAAYRCTQPVSLAHAETISNVLRYVLFKRGMLVSNVAEAAAFIRRDGNAAPDLELIFAPTFYMNHGFSNPPGDGFTVGAVLLHPKSSGTVTLRSADPAQPPSIDPACLSEPDDLKFLIEATHVCRDIASARAFDACRGEEVWPGPAARSDGEIGEFIRTNAESLYHPVGTCRMGNDALAVVDSRLRVRGVDALRVADASVMPSVPSGHTNAPTIMIAERAAEWIRGR